MRATAVLAQFAATTPSGTIPEEARAAARRHLLDCAGVSLAASVEPPGLMAAEVVRETGGTPEARLLGSGVHTSALQSAWGNSVLPADICVNFGEEYVGDTTTAHLLRTAEEVSRAGVEPDVRGYVGP
jgi:MmgE/PrpD N-terminal domain